MLGPKDSLELPEITVLVLETLTQILTVKDPEVSTSTAVVYLFTYLSQRHRSISKYRNTQTHTHAQTDKNSRTIK